MQNQVTLDDVLASAEKFGKDNILECDFKKVRDLKTLNPKSKYDTTYIPVLFKFISNKLAPVKIKFSEQIISSSAKKPSGSGDEDDENKIPKHLQISFTRMNNEDIEGGDYIPKKKSSTEEQLKENNRISENIERYSKNNEKFLNVLDIIDCSYKKLCADLKSTANKNPTKFNFKLKKDRNQKDITVYSIKQSTRDDKETNTEVELSNPIYRLKIPVYKKDGRIGIWSNYNNTFKPIVFDTRKMNKKNNFQAVPAMVKCQGKMRPLDTNNASSFITYKSLIAGVINFESIVSSKFGLSFSNSFYNMYVYRHKAKTMQQSMTIEEIVQMKGGNESDNESDSDVELEEKLDDKEHDDDDKEDSDEEPDENDDEPDDSDDNDDDKEDSDDDDNDEDDEEETPIKPTKKNKSKK
jgi:hypothetical protein